jgi:two-component sensor histidine kinase
MTQVGGELSDEARTAELGHELALAQKRLADVDHRIKNDLQLITSVLALQARRLPEGLAREAVRGALDRLNAVAAVQRHLKPSTDPTRCELSALVRDLVNEAIISGRREDVEVQLDLSPVNAPARQAAPVALIAGELVRNALKHGFPDRPGRLSVGLAVEGGEVRLSVRDDGLGLTGGMPPSGFGATLIGLLVQQLRGAYEVTDARPGVQAVVRFPEAI